MTTRNPQPATRYSLLVNPNTMFEDQQPKSVEDIFDKVDAGAAVQPPVQPATPVQPMMAAPAAAAGGSKVFLFTVVGIIAVAVLGAGGLFAYSVFFAKKIPLTESTTPAVEAEEAVTTETPAAPAAETEQPAVNVDQFDTDKDGLTDAEEIKLGMNPNKNDTDADALFDYDEVKVYKTDPLKSDTDGDGFLDGEEVLKGYNPNGPGKLLDFDKAKAELAK